MDVALILFLSAAALLQVVGNYYYWETFALIYDKQAPYEALASSLREMVETSDYRNMSIKSAHYVTSETSESDIRSMLMQVKKYARGRNMCTCPRIYIISRVKIMWAFKETKLLPLSQQKWTNRWHFSYFFPRE